MAELLFIATTIFVAYVIFVAVGKNETPEPSKPETNSAPPAPADPAPATIAEKAIDPEPAITKPSSKRTPAKPKTASAKKAPAAPAPTPAAASTTPADSLKNPKTGEIAKIPASYSFAKRWIKDALVEEGLVEKVYKNNELNDETNAKIQSALQQLKAMAKYQ